MYLISLMYLFFSKTLCLIQGPNNFFFDKEKKKKVIRCLN
jgi:hypothetical protein